MSALSAREGYRLWASRYEAETAVSYLENELVAQLGVSTSDVQLLDVGCGTGRRLRDSGAQFSVGVDLAPEMLGAGASLREECSLAVADVRVLPLDDASFDVVWCRLVIGHVCDLQAAYAELSRVCRIGGVVIVTDIATAAVAAGHRRTFRDEDGVTREVEHFVHSAQSHFASARDAGLSIQVQSEGVVGLSIRSFYADAGRLAAYDEQRGLPLVSALRMCKTAA